MTTLRKMTRAAMFPGLTMAAAMVAFTAGAHAKLESTAPKVAKDGHKMAGTFSFTVK